MSKAANCTEFFLNPSKILEILSKIEDGYKSPKNDFFQDANRTFKNFEKLGLLTIDDEADYHLKNQVTCNVFGCNQVFETVFAFESHFNSLHRYLCSICKKNLPSAHLLDLHFAENHDSYFVAQAERKSMYQCYLEECQHKCATTEERKDHCIRAHKFPANFRFDQSTSAGKSKKSNRMKSTAKLNEADSKMNSSEEMGCDKDEKSKIKNISFGHQKTKVFNSSSHAKNLTKEISSLMPIQKEMESSPLENKQTTIDLMESLPTT